MALPKARPLIPAEVHSNPDIMGGMPCVRGTRVPAMTIVAELRAGASRVDIFHHYPSLPLDGIEAVRKWAAENEISLELEPAHR
ncbi:hypothetical protein BH10PSE9_BH10PSE9_01260 [soil metagenome]